MTQTGTGQVSWPDLAAKFAVSPHIHTDDHIWQFLRDNPVFADQRLSADYYFTVGAENAQKLHDLIVEYLPEVSESGCTLLEFASGYGMVTRHLRRVVPFARVTSCDIHGAAVNFTRSTLGEMAVLSAHRPEQLDVGSKFDVVFALSFFSHMPDATFGPWLAALYDSVADGGILIFTTHGQASIAMLGGHLIPDASGYAFAPQSEQGDLDTSEYGMTVTLPTYVINSLAQHTNGVLLGFRHAFWWKHQDVYIVRKVTAPAVSAAPPATRALASLPDAINRIPRKIKGRLSSWSTFRPGR